MAKSLRSKFKRKMRAIARVKKAPKEMARLNEVVARRAAYEVDAAAKEADAVRNAPADSVGGDMDTNTEAAQSTINLKTLKKADGSFPVWVNQRKKRELAKQGKKSKAAKKQKAKARR